jgi:hypothetical protein
VCVAGGCSRGRARGRAERLERNLNCGSELSAQ